MNWKFITSLNSHLFPYLILSLLFLGACKESSNSTDLDVFVYPDNEFIQYEGRIGDEDSSKVIYWSGTSVKIKFKGTKMAILLKDETYDNYFNVLIDGELTEILRPDTVKTSYLIAEDLSEGEHTLELFKRTEGRHGKTWFYGFNPEPGTVFTSIPAKTRRIEFYGNSITAGYAVEDYRGTDDPDSIYTNFYHSYANLTARHFDANYSAIVKSGIGITVSWEPAIMPEMWDKLDPHDPLSTWDFTQNVPNVVVVNLLQNDSWITLLPDNDQYKRRFVEQTPSIEFVTARYQDFVRNIRGKYRNAHIICMLGNMDITKENSPWPKHVKEVVEALDDPRMYTLVAPYVEVNGHPRKEEQKLLAEALIKLIEDKVGWR